MGFGATGDAICLRGDMALQGVKNCVKMVGDVLLCAEDCSTHLHRFHQVLTRCCEFEITQKEQVCGRRSSGELLQFHTLRSWHPG